MFRETPSGSDGPAQKDEVAAAGTPINVADLSARLDSVFKAVDKDGDGFMSFQETSKAIADPSFKDNDARLLGLLRLSSPIGGGGATGLHTDTEFGIKDSEKGLSLEDARRFVGMIEVTQKEKMNLKELSETISNGISVVSFWDELDRDGDLSLTKDELKNGLESKKLSDQSKESANVLYRNFDFLSKLDGKAGISIADARALDNARGHLVRAEPEAHGYLERQRVTPHPEGKLYTSENSIVPDAVRQGFVGSCFFLAPVGTIAQRDPDSIKRMITPVDGGYKVRFPGAAGIDVNVKPLTDTETFLYAGLSKHGTWVGVLEKAYGQLLADHTEFRPKDYIEAAPVPENLDAGGNDEAIKILTGNKPERMDFEENTSVDSVKKRLAKAKADGELVVAGSATEDKDFFAGHAYSVTKLEDDSVTLRNPHGVVRLGQKNGIPFERAGDTGNVTISIADFTKKFHTAVFVSPQKK